MTNYPPIYHAALSAMIADRPKPETRRKIAKALRWLRNNRTRAEYRREYRHFVYVSPWYFTR